MEFVERWGSCIDEELRGGVAACILEHLLQCHFARPFPRVEARARTDPLFTDCFARCWSFGQTEEPANRERFEALESAVGAI